MPTAQEIHEDCCKAQAEGKHESPERAAETIKFVRQLTCNHAGYEALLLPLTVCPETPRSDVLFRQCLAALSANKVRPQLPLGSLRLVALSNVCLQSRSSKHCPAAFSWRRVVGLSSG